MRPLKALTVAAFGVALVGIVANAMVLQRGRQSGPVSGLDRSVDVQPDALSPRATVPAPAAPAQVEHTGAVPAPAVPVLPAVPPKPAPPPSAAPRAHRHDDHGGDHASHADVGHHQRPGHRAASAEPKADPVANLLARPAKPERASASGKAAEAHGAPKDPKGKAEAMIRRHSLEARRDAADAPKPPIKPE